MLKAAETTFGPIKLKRRVSQPLYFYFTFFSNVVTAAVEAQYIILELIIAKEKETCIEGHHFIYSLTPSKNRSERIMSL